MSESVKLGKVSMTLGGDYSSSQAYDKLTCVQYDGRSWVSRKQVPAGVAPTEANSAYWQKISERGVQGPQGQSYVDKELVPIVNDLTTGGSSNVLSAEQGKVLDGKVAKLSEELGVYQGEKKTKTLIFTKDEIPSGNTILVSFVAKDGNGNVLVKDASSTTLKSFAILDGEIGQVFPQESYVLPSDYQSIEVGNYGDIELSLIVATINPKKQGKEISSLAEQIEQLSEENINNVLASGRGIISPLANEVMKNDYVVGFYDEAGKLITTGTSMVHVKVEVQQGKLYRVEKVARTFAISSLVLFDKDDNVIYYDGEDREISSIFNFPSYIKAFAVSSRYTEDLQVYEGDPVKTLGGDFIQDASITNFKIADESVTPSKTTFFVQSKNLYDYSVAMLGYVQTGDEPRVSEAYALSDFIQVEQGVNYILSPSSARFVAYFDENKNFLSYESNLKEIMPSQNGFVRLSLDKISYQSFQFERGSIATSYEPYKLIVNPDYLEKNKDFVQFYMPQRIYVATGRTIEIYYEQIVLNAHKYNINAYWKKNGNASDSTGIPLERKFQIIGGQTAGSYTLTISVHDDEFNELARGESEVVVASSNISSEKRFLPIGSSLTNNKSWLLEVQNLSNGKLKMVGTRGVGQYSHEGRSGGTTSEYNDTTGKVIYTYDNNYRGVGANADEFNSARQYNVGDYVKYNNAIYRFTKSHLGEWSASDVYNVSQTNPFYNPATSQFSMDYYKSLHGILYDVIIITLGGNELNDNATGADGIKQLVDNIRIDDATTPIIITQTLFKSNQNGIGRQGNTDGFHATPDYKFHKDWQVQQLLSKTSELLHNYANVYICPMAETNDSAYNFGNIKTAVNPRLTNISEVYELYPIDSTHPQEAGYGQMADEIFSCLCYIFNK